MNFCPGVAGAINNDPQLSTLAADQKQDLQQLVSGAVTGSLLMIGLNEVANTRTAWLNSTATGQCGRRSSSDTLAPLGGPSGTAQEAALAQTPLCSYFSFANPSRRHQSQAIESGTQQTGNLKTGSQQTVWEPAKAAQATGLTAQEATRRAGQAYDAAIEYVHHQRNNQLNLQHDAYRHTVAKEVQTKQNLSDSEAKRIANTVAPPNTNANLAQLNHAALTYLPKQGLTAAEASGVAQQATAAFLAKQPSLNPLSSYTTEFIGNQTQLAESFKSTVTAAISPTLGTTKALQVAEDYGNLIFSSPNSTLSKMRTIHYHQQQHSQFLKDQAADDYRLATKIYRNPGVFFLTLTLPAKTLLALGAVGGPSMQGATFLDNNVGRTGHFTGHPTDLAG